MTADPPAPDVLPGVLRRTVVATVRADGPDLSARQLAVLLAVHLDEGPHTVRGLAAALGVSKPAVTRALDRLGALDLARRRVDPADRRSVLVRRTAAGQAMLAGLRAALGEAAAAEAEAGPGRAPAGTPVEAGRGGA